MSDPHNTGTLTGGLVAEPEIFKDKVAKLRIAVDYAGTDSNDSKDRSGYFDAVFFLNNDTPNSKFVSGLLRDKKLSKGSQVSIVYSLRQERFQDKDGNRRNSITLIVDSLTYAKNNKASGEEGNRTQTASASNDSDAPSMIDEF